MYEYTEKSNPLYCKLPENVDVLLDNIPVKYPYVPRICKEQGYMLIWHGTEKSDPDIAKECFNAKHEEQWITCNDNWKIEKAVALIWPYENELIIGAVKYPGYMNKRSSSQIRQWMRKVWLDLILMFQDKKIICPTGTYFDYLHLTMNQMKIPKESYHKRMMKKYGFSKEGYFWIRYPKKWEQNL